jgi:hypothetical protein
VNLLTVEEVMELWQCRRITILRLMKNRVLPWFEDEDGEPLFDQAEVLKIRNPRTAGPRLRLVGASETPALPEPRPVPTTDELLERRDKLTEELRTITEQARAIRATSQLLLKRAQSVLEECAEADRRSWHERGRSWALRTGRVTF